MLIGYRLLRLGKQFYQTFQIKMILYKYIEIKNKIVVHNKGVNVITIRVSNKNLVKYKNINSVKNKEAHYKIANRLFKSKK